MPVSFLTRCFSLPDLFAGKMHALLFRTWGNRVKGRDWYDFEWYVRHEIPLNFSHFLTRTQEFNNQTFDSYTFKQMLKEKLASTDIELVKRDVIPFIQNTQELNIWSNDYFVLLADRIKFSPEIP